MVADEHNAGVGGDLGESDSAASQHSHGQHSGLSGQGPLHTTPFTYAFPSSAPQSVAVSRPNAAKSAGKDHATDAEDTDYETPIVGKTIGEGSNPRPRSSATPVLSAESPATSRQGAVQEPRRVPLSPVSPRSPPDLRSPALPSRLPSSAWIRERGSSLRSAILSRNVQPCESSESAMELQGPVDSSCGKKPEVPVGALPVLEIATYPQYTKKPNESIALPNYEKWIKNKAAHSDLLSRIGAAKEGIRRKILRVHEISPSKEGRHIDVDPARKEPLIDERTGRAYIKNTITSRRYTLYNFIPRQFVAQFSKLANFYFLCVSILQMIPDLSTTGTYTTIVPLAFFVLLSMAKEGYDDLRRYRLDRAENRKTAMVLCRHRASANSTEYANSSTTTSTEWQDWTEVKWENIGVGDIVKLTRDEAAPADIVVLFTNGAEGIAYVETMALDGETNLKSKQPLPQLARCCNTEGCKAHIIAEDPNIDLYKFEGKVTVETETLPLTNNEVIYRGSVLRNTSSVIGIVIYSGEECKIRMNATKNPRIKAVST